MNELFLSFSDGDNVVPMVIRPRNYLEVFPRFLADGLGGIEKKRNEKRKSKQMDGQRRRKRRRRSRSGSKKPVGILGGAFQRLGGRQVQSHHFIISLQAAD